MRLANKVALITGAGGGIGGESALLFAAQGASVVVVDIADKAGEETVRRVKAAGGKAAYVRADVSKDADCAAMIAFAEKTFGRLDVLFNNAGTSLPAVPTEDLAYEQWKQVVDVNLTGMFLCAQQAIRIMKDQDPRGGDRKSVV